MTVSPFSIRFVLAGLGVLICGLSSAQPGIHQEWNYGGSSYDRPRAIERTPGGGFILAGRSGSDDFDVSSNYGGSDVWLVKLDSAGNIEWERNYGGSGEDDAHSLQVTDNGEYIVAGYSYSSNGDLGGNYGSADYWLLKLDASGNIEWEQNYGGSNYDVARHVIQTVDGGYVLSGSSFSSDVDVSNNQGYDDFWTVKVDSSGNIEWEENYGGSDYDGAHTIRQTADSGFVMTGYVNSGDGDVSNFYGGGDLWVVRTDSLGTLQWERNYGGSGKGSGRCIEVLPGGDLLLAGSTSSSDYDVSANNGQDDYWLARLDSSGNILWENNYGGSSTEELSTVMSTSDGGYLLQGHSSSNDGDVGGNYGNSDYWTVKLDPSGNIEWEQNYGGSDMEEAMEGFLLEETKKEAFLIAGFAASSDQDVSDNHGGGDQWVVNLYGPCDTVLLQKDPVSDTVCNGDTAIFSVQEVSYYNNISYEWQVDDGSGWNSLSAPSDDSLILPGVGSVDSGNIYRCVVSDTCGNIDTSGTAELTVPPKVSFSTKVQDLSCFGYSDGVIEVNPSGGFGPYRFSLDGGSSFSSYTSGGKTFSGLSDGAYQILVEDTIGCQSSISTDSILEPSPLIADPGTSDTICEGDSTTLGGSPTASGGTSPYTYVWDPTSSLSSSTVANPKASPSSDTNYQVVVVDDSGCTDTSAVIVSVDPAPSTGLPLDTALCGTNDSLLLSVPGGHPFYSWSTGSTDSTSKVYSQGQVMVEVQNAQGCFAYDSVTVGMDTSTEAVIQAQAQVITCYNGGSTVLNGDSSQTQSGSIAYAWSTSNGNITGSTSSDSAIVDAAGDYLLKVNDPVTGCSDTSKVNLAIDTASPDAVVETPDSLYCDTDSVLLDASASSSNSGGTLLYQWSTSNGVLLGGKYQDSALAGEIGGYSVTVTDSSNGCQTAEAVEVLGEDCFSGLRVYNAFTPDGDGQNDIWFIRGIQEYPENEVRIMNRWGDVVNRFKGYDNRKTVWKGKNGNGDRLPAGTYYYIIQVEGPPEKLTGWVQVTR